MIFFLIAAVITIVYSIHQYIKYYSFSRIWDWFKSEFLLTAFSTCAVALMISGLLAIIYCDVPSSEEHSVIEVENYHELKPMSEDTYIQWGSDNSAIVLLDNGYYQTYELDNSSVFIKTCADGEVPNVKTINYTKYNDYRKWICLWNALNSETIITLPPGICKPIT